MDNSNLVWSETAVQKADRERLNGHGGAVVWLTGLSGSGKSTLASAVDQRLHKHGVRSYVLDGDNVRHGLCNDLGFSAQDRSENIRRVAEVARLFSDAGMLVLAAFISPFKQDRDKLRNLFEPGVFYEVHCNCPLDVCEQRDVKGLYKRARAGLLQEFTGVSSPYEEPLNPDCTIDTASLTLEQSVDHILDLLHERSVLRRS
jgi:adenylylsulfate kinase